MAEQTRISDRLGDWLGEAIEQIVPEGETVEWDVMTMPVQTPNGPSIGAGIALIFRGVLIGSKIPLLVQIQDVTVMKDASNIVDVVRQSWEAIQQQRSTELTQAGGQSPNGNGVQGLHAPGNGM